MKCRPSLPPSNAHFEVQVGEVENKQNRYEPLIFWSDEDQSFVVEVAELPGCMTDGATCQEAVKNVDFIIDEWIVAALALGRPVPLPAGKLKYA